MGRGLPVTTGLAFAVHGQTPVDTHRGMCPTQVRLFFFFFLEKLIVFLNSRTKKVLKQYFKKAGVLENSQGFFRGDELLPSFPLDP